MSNIAHADHVLSLLKRAVPVEKRPVVLSSWRRCVEHHGLDPHRLPPPTVLSTEALADYREPVDDLLSLARDEVDRLFMRLRDYQFAVTFANCSGVTLLMRCAQNEWNSYRAAGVIVGSVWSEESQGTNGIGTCIKEGRPISIVMDEHFSPELAMASCTVAPVLGASQKVVGLLNVTTVVPTTHNMQDMVRDVVHRSARRIENVYFDRRHGSRNVFRLSRQGDFNDLASEERLAIGSDGRIIEATMGAAQLLRLSPDSVIGTSFEDMLRHSQPSASTCEPGVRAVTAEGGSRFFVRPLHHRPPDTVQTPPAPAKRPQKVAAKPAAEEFAALLGNDPVVLDRFNIVQRLVNRRLPVLLQGETGTGKSTLAKILHRNSTHADGEFVSLNCAAIPPDLIESELFGYRSGAFTGALRQGYKGRLLEADGGTLFLDEIGDMPLQLQTRFLHVLSDGEFVPVGATRPVRIEVAVISASHHDIARLVREGHFREDLYFRLNGATRTLPPLRQRGDRGMIIEQVLREEAGLIGQSDVKVDPEVFRTLHAYHWPGNIRELRHVARFAVTVADGGAITLDCLPSPFDGSGHQSGESPSGESMERRVIQAALVQSDWNVSETAKRLGISRSTLHRKMKSLGLQRSTAGAEIPSDRPA